jgi:hypothetical protein
MILDITESKKPLFWKEEWSPKIPIVKGSFNKEFDIDVFNINPEIYLAAVQRSVKKFQESGRSYRLDWPIGFNKNDLPYGAKILKES